MALINKYQIFYKQISGIDKQIPDILAKAELGLYLIMSGIIKQNFRYWQSIISSHETSLTYKALQANINGSELPKRIAKVHQQT